MFNCTIASYVVANVLTTVLCFDRAKKIPLIIRRYLPDKSYEDWAVDELIIP